MPPSGVPAAPSGEHGGLDPFGGVIAYPDRPKAPQAVLDRGRTIFGVNCGFCHGSDAGGGTTGPNLLRSEAVLQDHNGERILPIVQGARISRGMPTIDISAAQVSDIAAWLHSIPVKSDAGHEKMNILVGDAKTGSAAFARMCASCHSVSGDLKGFAAKFSYVRDMQQAWIMPAMQALLAPGVGATQVKLNVPPVTATVTEADGKTVTGTLKAVDEFIVTLSLPNNQQRTWTRTGGFPEVQIHDPLEPHRAMLRTYQDSDIHNITAYLASLK